MLESSIAKKVLILVQSEELSWADTVAARDELGEWYL